jgi:hypothetical protein
MNGKIIAAVGVVVVATLVVGYLVLGKSHSKAPVKVSLRLSVTPGEQAGFVIQQANSAKFKYQLGKIAGVEPFLAQRLTLQLVPNSSLLEAQVRVQNREDAHRYAEAFVEVLQAVCGPQAQLALERQTIQ